MSIMHRNFTLGNIYSLTPAQERMVAEINAADAKRADELAASLEAIAVQALADVAQLSATDAALAALAGENAALRLALEKRTAEATLNQITVTDQSAVIRSLRAELGISREAHKGLAWAIARISAPALAAVWPDLEDIAGHDDNETSIYTRIERNAVDGCEALLAVALGESYLTRCGADGCELYGCSDSAHPDDEKDLPR